MKKITFQELCKIMHAFNEEHNCKPFDKEHILHAVIVFTEDSFKDPYTEVERSYKVCNGNKFWLSGYISNSLFGDCLDGKDDGVRLDWYIYPGGDAKPWKVDYCYLLDE